MNIQNISIMLRTGGDIKKKIYPDPNKFNPSRWNAREDTFLAC